MLRGHVERDGEWLTDRAVEWRANASRVSELVRQARTLEIDVKHANSSLPPVRAIYGNDAHRVSAHGVTLHGGIPAAKLERILREALRAMALSRGLLDGVLEVPHFDRECHLVMLLEEDDYDAALDDAMANEGISAESYALHNDTRLHSFQDRRGWRTSRWRDEAGFQALIVWQLEKRWMGRGTQPCFLAGHLNWLCLNFFGTTMPSVAWKEKVPNEQRTSSVRTERGGPLWRSAARSLYGCREWMKTRVRAGDEFPFARAIVAEIGMIADETLLKATLMNEYLQSRGELRTLVDLTRSEENRIASIESALGRSLPELEDEWGAWLLDESARPGLLQRLVPQPSNKSESGGRADAMLAALRDVRDRAFRDLNVWVETVDVNGELSSQARAHALYLTLNPEQGLRWPDAHEEYADHEGFSPEGAWAGLHSVIHFTPDPAEAIDGWMGTFFHRLPLLEPGLFGIGHGNEGRVTVLDTSSLVAVYWGKAWVVWPPRGARDVPRRFQPELPNPVPGEDQSTWGYPITLQAYWPERRDEYTVEMQLYLGEESIGDRVPCHYLTPTEPAFDKLVPSDAYCLIPKSHLEAEATYTVTAKCPEANERQTWSFTTGR